MQSSNIVKKKTYEKTDSSNYVVLEHIVILV